VRRLPADVVDHVEANEYSKCERYDDCGCVGIEGKFAGVRIHRLLLLSLLRRCADDERAMKSPRPGDGCVGALEIGL
jgi:hypothetical protein